MARKVQEPPPYAEVVVYRPNGVEYLRRPVNALTARGVMGEVWRDITNGSGWTPDIRVIRHDGTDITRLV